MALTSLERRKQLQSPSFDNVHNNMLKLGNQRLGQSNGTQTRRSITIVANRGSEKLSFNRRETYDDSRTENLYDMATWRMYNRIVEYRNLHPPVMVQPTVMLDSFDESYVSLSSSIRKQESSGELSISRKKDGGGSSDKEKLGSEFHGEVFDLDI